MSLNQKISTSVELDSIDRRILRELVHDGRVSVSDLAQRVGLSTTPCWRRVRALEDRSVIKGYTCSIAPEALGLNLEALIHLTLERHAEFAIQQLIEELRSIPEIVECFSLTGQFDVLLRVFVADLAALNELLLQRLSRVPGVAQFNSSLVLNRLIDRQAVPSADVNSKKARPERALSPALPAARKQATERQPTSSIRSRR